ncbi:MAG: hypothetical protein ACK58T_32420, partial [Phycisphaerae bacterium]
LHEKSEYSRHSSPQPDKVANINRLKVVLVCMVPIPPNVGVQRLPKAVRCNDVLGLVIAT